MMTAKLGKRVFIHNYHHSSFFRQHTIRVAAEKRDVKQKLEQGSDDVKVAAAVAAASVVVVVVKQQRPPPPPYSSVFSSSVIIYSSAIAKTAIRHAKAGSITPRFFASSTSKKGTLLHFCPWKQYRSLFSPSSSGSSTWQSTESQRSPRRT